MTNSYNTRRKSLSLEALGVQVPGLGRAHSHRVAADTKADAAAQHDSQTHDASSPPAKRVKRSHSLSTAANASSPSSQRPSSAGLSQAKSSDKITKAQQQESQRAQTRHVEYTPPPSPPADGGRRIDYESISDDIVEGVVRQLEKTGNRPHLIKELAAVLSTTHDSVTSSANAPALLSSRLANYMKRPCWNGSNPCPVGKQLIPVHPRKVFYYLTDRERLVLPDNSDDIYGPLGITSPTRAVPPAATPPTAGVGTMGPPSTLPAKRPFTPALLTSGFNVSPPLSNASVAEDDVESSAPERGRFAMSPSPEVDLSIHDTDYEHADDEQSMQSDAVHSAVDNVKRDFATPPSESSSQSSYTSARSSLSREDGPASAAPTNSGTRHQSPPLEGAEAEFTETVRQFRERGSGTNTPVVAPIGPEKAGTVKEEQGRAEGRDELFAHPSEKDFSMSSPAFRPQAEHRHQGKASIGDVVMIDADVHTGEGLYKWDLEAVSDIQVDDLDSLLAGY